MDRWIKLYNEEGEYILNVRLSEDGYEKYLLGEEWNPSWIEIIIDVKAVLRAEF